MEVKRKKDTKEYLEKRLLMFEDVAGQPIVVSLLIENNTIEFISCVRKKGIGDFEDDDEQPNIDLEKVKGNVKSNLLVSKDKQIHYIG